MANLLKELSDALAGTVETAQAGIVRVEGRRRLPASGIVWSADGLVVTAHHVLTRDENIKVGLPNGEEVSAALVGRDPTTDLALLRTNQSGSWVFPQLDAAQVKVGHLALAAGRPGDSVEAALGMVNALGESWRTPAGALVDRYVQTDITMFPGFSGGPLLDTGGQLIGMNTSMLLRDATVTVPVLTIKRVVDALLAHGRIRRGYLGVGSQVVRLPEALSQSLKQKTGLLVVSVEPGSPAERGGLLMGDTLVGFAGLPLTGMDDLYAALSTDRISTTQPVRLVRGGQTQELQVILGERE
jgi:S1-C subfamily serine protease